MKALFIFIITINTVFAANLIPVSSQVTQLQAISDCHEQEMRLPTKKEISDEFKSQTNASKDGSALTSDANWEFGEGQFWTSNRHYTADVVVIIESIFVIPFPREVGDVLNVYFNNDQQQYIGYLTPRRPNSDGKYADTLCIK